MSGPGGVAGDQLRALVERIEHVDEEIKALTEDKKDIYAEAKGEWLRREGDPREVVRIRKKDPKERDEAESPARHLLARDRHGGTAQKSSVSFRIYRVIVGRLRAPFRLPDRYCDGPAHDACLRAQL